MVVFFINIIKIILNNNSHRTLIYSQCVSVSFRSMPLLTVLFSPNHINRRPTRLTQGPTASSTRDLQMCPRFSRWWLTISPTPAPPTTATGAQYNGRGWGLYFFPLIFVNCDSNGSFFRGLTTTSAHAAPPATVQAAIKLDPQPDTIKCVLCASFFVFVLFLFLFLFLFVYLYVCIFVYLYDF